MTALTESCKKYEEGPCLSLRSAKNRIYGNYKLTTYTVNGADSLNLFNDSLCNNLKFFHDNNSNTDGCTINGVRNDGAYNALVWTWHLDKNNSILIVTYSSCLTGIGVISWPSGTGPFVDTAKPEWNILRLTNKEIKMKTNFNNKEYIIKLNAIKS
jgi:hypothetical protein